MRRRLYLYALLIVCFTVAHARAQQDFSKVQMKATKVAGNIYMLEGAGGNIGVSAGADGLLIVDDQFAPLADKIRAALKAINPGQLRFVLNTHYHGDHTGSNPVFGREATIIAHDNVRGRLATEQTVRGQKIPASPREALPVITFNQSVSIHFNGEEIRAIHFPNGHTDGDSVIFFTASNVVHMGDHFFAGRFPFIDIEHGGTVEGLTRNVETVIARVPADVKIIPGHGPLSTLDDLKLYQRMLTETTAHIRKGMAEGKTLQQLKTAGFPDEWKTWGTGFINSDFWVETIYNSLSANTNKK
ncbi:MAG TPA: MBL fold metallo-hydrolase [Pyrinomonadaceae bacterium]|nr:MBL fold metallo-hydrolase [Pyrinomonadaceae bacterium]